jgi:transcriptional regulator with XRE-family HTH domain
MTRESDAKIQSRFGGRIRELRKERGLSQETLAFACHLDRTYIGSVERGERNISIINIYSLARALKIPVRDLFDA